MTVDEEKTLYLIDILRDDVAQALVRIKQITDMYKDEEILLSDLLDTVHLSVKSAHIISLSICGMTNEITNLVKERGEIDDKTT